MIPSVHSTVSRGAGFIAPLCFISSIAAAAFSAIQEF